MLLTDEMTRTQYSVLLQRTRPHLQCSTVNNEATHCAVPPSRVARRRADDVKCSTAFRSSVLSASLQTLSIKRRGGTCLVVSSFLSVILNFLTELGLTKLCSLPYACTCKVMPVHATKAHREKERRAHGTMYS